MGGTLDQSFNSAKIWRQEAEKLREILLGCGLTEERKWGKPCYSSDGRNIVIIQRMKDFLALLFFKGGLLDDPDGLLERQGPNSRAGFRMRFTSVAEITAAKASIEAYVREAIAAEKAGLKVETPADPDMPAELKSRLEADHELKAAFEALTPGRQRGYCLYFGAPKQSATREGRIDKYRQTILDGKGFHDR